jgi:putative FmdB family regulatory protein
MPERPGWLKTAGNRRILSPMPFYEYECDACGEVMVVLQSLSEPKLRDCPSGDGGKLTKLLSAHNVARGATGLEAASCEQSFEPSCQTCGKAGTGCS